MILFSKVLDIKFIFYFSDSYKIFYPYLNMVYVVVLRFNNSSNSDFFIYQCISDN